MKNRVKLKSTNSPKTDINYRKQISRSYFCPSISGSFEVGDGSDRLLIGLN